MFSTQSLDRLLTFLGIFCRDELRRDGIPCASPFGNHERDYLARHGVPLRLISQLSGRDRFDELANRIRDYPGSLPATVQENRKEFDEIRAVLHSIETDTNRPEPEVWQRLESLRAQIQDGAIRAREVAETFQDPTKLTAHGWQCPNGVVRVQNWLKSPLEAYLGGAPKFVLDSFSNPADIQYGLKKLIRKAREIGFQPPENRWPSARKDISGERTVFFDATEKQNRRNQGNRKKI